ncbi:binding ATPase YchF [Seminavis robusta]|uniref:Obg-like ATPase 1 n=1 Tax=Seminavis robusta TaxID=568900 RepID=A0A9N8EXH9_9STRA|nr:binding ATPase YchF [Seminavis robusta]|eukprot:Sro1985_g309410.1 binding ATPase YchF (409) ;mRNA; f:3153-4611
MKLFISVSMMFCILSRTTSAFSSLTSSSFTRVNTFRRGYSKSTLSMKLQTAIVGLPNVGKSTLFNALTETQSAEAANYPFCTIESNVGIVSVPDPKLKVLSDINSSEKIVPATLEFVDVAGLIKGASSGEGLGNQFLTSIRQCDAVVHVVRCFENEDVIHVDGTIDPIRDAELINLELALADLASVEKRLERVRKDRNADPIEKQALEKVAAVLLNDEPARNANLDDEEKLSIKSLGLLTLKSMIYAANVADEELATGNAMVDKLKEMAEKEGAKLVIVSAQVESELIELDDEERKDFLADLGVELENCGLRALVRNAYDLLQLQTYYTSGPTETRAWTIQKGWLAPQAAGVIHNDFERGFIRAETISYDHLVDCGSEANAKSKGLLRSEGKEYVVQEGDVILFRFNV